MLIENLKNIQIDSVLLNLSMYCPTYCPSFENNKSCQLSKTQKFSSLQKIEWLKKFTEKQKLEIISKHEDCFEKKR